MIFTSSEYFTMIIAIWYGEVEEGASVLAEGAPLVFQSVFIYFWKEVYISKKTKHIRFCRIVS